MIRDKSMQATRLDGISDRPMFKINTVLMLAKW